MKVLFTGVSSFTGFWIANYFANNGCVVDAILTKKSLNEYDSLRIARLSNLQSNINLIFDCKFGDNTFLSLLKNNKYEIIIHHASYVNNYNSNSFDWKLATNENTYNIENVVEEISVNPNAIFAFSSTVFEKGGLEMDQPINKYALSKKNSKDIIEFFCFKNKIKFTNVYIPNPFGPFEDLKLNHYILNSWQQGNEVIIKTPSYIRDFLPVDLLAISYFDHIISLQKKNALKSSFSPSGYKMTINNYLSFLANKLYLLTGEKKFYKSETQENYNEPIELVNEFKVLTNENWDENRFWIQYFNYYNFI